MYVRSKSVVANELISFATQYSSVQKRLLNEFEVPYALLEYSGKILWVNDKFAELMGVDKNITNPSRHFSDSDQRASHQE